MISGHLFVCFNKLISSIPSRLLSGVGRVGLSCLLGELFIYKNLIYYLNFQFYCINKSHPIDILLNNYRLEGGKSLGVEQSQVPLVQKAIKDLA